MSRVRHLIPHPTHQIAAESQDRWRAEGSDPRFRLDGPFARGFWDLTFTGAAPVDVDHVRVCYWHDGRLSAAVSIRLPAPAGEETRRTLRFWMPEATPWVLLDSTEAAGPVHFSAVEAVRTSPAFGLLRGIVARLRHAPARTLADLRAIVTTARRDRHERNRRLLALAFPDADDGEYERWLQRRVTERLAEYPAHAQAGLFSLLTTIFDTPAPYIDALADSVRAQTWADFEWVILDNGSRSTDTRAAIDRLARDPRARLFPNADNQGKKGGMRYVLERATKP
jgi:hypothetical protein